MVNSNDFLKSLGLTPIRLLDNVMVWEINGEAAEDLISRLGKNFEKRQLPQRRDQIYFWNELSIVLIISPLNTGLIFESKNDAERIIPMLREHEFFTKKDFILDYFWFLSLDQEEIERLLKNTNWQKYPMDGFNVFANKQTGNFMSRIGADRATWFQKEEHFQFYVKRIKQMEAML